MDAGKIRDALSNVTITLMIDTVMVLLGAILLYAHSPMLFGITLLLIPFYIGIIFVFHKPYQRINRKEMESNAKLTSYLIESLNGIATVKSYNAEKKCSIKQKVVLLIYLDIYLKRNVIEFTGFY